MKKIILILVLVLFFLVGCSQNDNDIIDELEGEYYYVKVIYLAPYSSGSLYYPNLPGSLVIEFTEEQIVYHRNGLEETETYTDIEFRKEEVNKDLDAVINLDFDGVFETFDYRYDIYSDGTSIGLTIFIDDETFYLAETRMIGGSHDIFSVYSIIEIEQ
ncbi:MAG: hypothetical protein K9L64_06785 [Candidatus Izimaplasma sp.]|nr:hypothetical protein [Candidatus Izimaplasma bacterium]